VITLQDQVQAKDQEIDALKFLNDDLRATNQTLENEMLSLSALLDRIKFEKEAMRKDYENRIAKLKAEFEEREARLEEEGQRGAKRVADELRVSVVIRKRQEESITKLKEELKELKSIIKVPRLHFKYLEKLEYKEIME